MNYATIIQHFENISQKKVLIIGDIFLDEYIYGNAQSISTGIKIPIIEKNNTIYCLGGAGNVAANIRPFVKKVDLFCGCAKDPCGKKIKEMLKNFHVNGIFYNTKKTICKQRFYVGEQQVLRLDDGKKTNNISLRHYPALSNYDLVILVDYDYGIVSPKIIDTFQTQATAQSKKIFFSSRCIENFKLRNNCIIVVNEKEYSCQKKLKYNPIFITNGDKGITYKKMYSENFCPAARTFVKNESGAGDSVLAVLAALYDHNFHIMDLLKIANIVGGLAVNDKHTFVLNKDLLLSKVFDYAISEDHYQKVQNLDILLKLSKIWKKTNEKIVFTNGCFDILHLGHIASIDFAKKQGTRLIAAINSDNSIKKLKGPQRPINSINERISALSYLKSIDALIVFDSANAINLIKHIKPDVYVKGEEYKKKKLVESTYAPKTIFAPMVHDISSSKIIRKISKF